MWPPGINFINVLCAHFLYKILAPKITKLCFVFEIFWSQNFVQKMRALNIDEIDGWLYLQSLHLVLQSLYDMFKLRFCKTRLVCEVESLGGNDDAAGRSLVG